MARLELEEREVCFTQSAQDRRDGVWHCYTNDPYWQRRFERVDAQLVKEQGENRFYTVKQRQLLIRRVPAARNGSTVGLRFRPQLDEDDEDGEDAEPLSAEMARMFGVSQSA